MDEAANIYALARMQAYAAQLYSGLSNSDRQRGDDPGDLVYSLAGLPSAILSWNSGVDLLPAGVPKILEKVLEIIHFGALRAPYQGETIPPNYHNPGHYHACELALLVDSLLSSAFRNIAVGGNFGPRKMAQASVEEIWNAHYPHGLPDRIETYQQAAERVARRPKGKALPR